MFIYYWNFKNNTLLRRSVQSWWPHVPMHANQKRVLAHTNLSTLPDILHTVGPTNGSRRRLKSCYSKCLQLALESNIRSLVTLPWWHPRVGHFSCWVPFQAFCCIATGIYGMSEIHLVCWYHGVCASLWCTGYPNQDAARVALETVREWLEMDGNVDKVEARNEGSVVVTISPACSRLIE